MVCAGLIWLLWKPSRLVGEYLIFEVLYKVPNITKVII